MIPGTCESPFLCERTAVAPFAAYGGMMCCALLTGAFEMGDLLCSPARDVRNRLVGEVPVQEQPVGEMVILEGHDK
jgi:hypothetical protein